MYRALKTAVVFDAGWDRRINDRNRENA